MGLLDQITGGGGGAQKKPGLGDTVAAGVLLALAVKAARGFEARRDGAQPRSFDPNPTGPTSAPPAGGGGGILGSLGGLGGLAGMTGGLGGLLGQLGGTGALSSLVSRFQQQGYGDHVNSWVNAGANQPIQPNQVADALGEQTVSQLQQQTGIPRESLLSELAHNLPDAINKLTPNGRLPTESELSGLLHGAA